MDNPVVHCVANPASEIGENPLWHEEEKVLYWCDILRGRLYRYDPASQKTLLVRDGNAQRRALGGFTIGSREKHDLGNVS